MSGASIRGASRHVILSGCSGGGKSTLLAELARRGFDTVPEPGRRIVTEALRTQSAPLPWADLAAFAMRALEIADQDRRGVSETARWTFFDRGLIDAAAALQRATGRPVAETLTKVPPYHRIVFLTPPWPEIYVADRERRHDFHAAIEEYECLLLAYRDLGYQPCVLPKISVAERADLVLLSLG